MIVVGGARQVRRRQGYVAAFCPICRGIRAWLVRGVYKAAHFFFVPVGVGKCLRQETVCTGCGYKRRFGPLTYRRFVRERDADIDRLVAETRPHLLLEIEDRLVLEERARGTGQPLSREERLRLMAEPMYALSDQVQRRFRGETHIDTAAGFALLGTILLVFLFLLVGPIGRVHGPLPVLAWVVAGAGVLSLAGTIYLAATIKRRYIKGRIVPFLVKALAPLGPTRDELDEVIGRARERGLLIGRKLDAAWVVAGIRAAQLRREQGALRG